MTALSTKVAGAFVWLTLLTLGFAGAFLFIIAQSYGIGKDIASVQAASAVQTEIIRGVKEDVGDISRRLDRQDDNAKRSPRDGQDSGVP
jgi:hypothetical protein